MFKKEVYNGTPNLNLGRLAETCSNQINSKTYDINVAYKEKPPSPWYSKCYGMVSVTKKFTFQGIQTIHRSRALSHPFQFISRPITAHKMKSA
jgi:hypothetical protein